MEIGISSFGDLQRSESGEYGSTAEAITNLLEAIQLADKVGLDFFGVGEHHTMYAPASSPGTVLAAAASSTKNIKLVSAVSVLSTDDPVRIYQQFATAAIISKGRIEITAGRGSSIESFPLFGYNLQDYDELYAEKLDLLMKLNALDKNEHINWEGNFRAPLKDATIVPQPDDPIKIWLATGGNPQSSVRAGMLGLPIAYGALGGHASRFAPLVDLYHRAAEKYGPKNGKVEVAFGGPGFVADDAKDAKDTFWKYWQRAMKIAAEQRGFAIPTRAHFDAESNTDGSLFVGSPDEIADRIIALHKIIGHSRHIFQFDIGSMPHDKFLHAIELLGTKVAPKVREALKNEK